MSLNSLQACPSCGTVQPKSNDHCSESTCRQPLAWTRCARDVREGLTNFERHRRVELHVRLAWGGGKSELSQPLGRDIDFIPAGRSGAWRLVVSDDWKSLVFQVNGRTERHALPTHDQIIEGVAITARLVVRPQVAADCPGIEDYWPRDIPIGDRKTIGSEATREADLEQIPRGLALRHFVIARLSRDAQSTAWIVDLGSETGTFVNRRPIAMRLLESGDLVQAGPFAWVFNCEDGLLIPVRPFRAAELRLRDVTIPVRIPQPINLSIPPGQFVAITGPSGSGKSSLLNAILGEANTGRNGEVRIGDFDSAIQTESFRASLGYLAQSNDAISKGLRAQEAVWLTAGLRGAALDWKAIERLLHQVGIPAKRWQAMLPDQLSGGELQRVRIAAELATRPPILLLDEPGTGLDPQRERQLMRLLRVLSSQGCTIVVVTHSTEQLDLVDRVIRIETPCRIISDSRPSVSDKSSECSTSGSLPAARTRKMRASRTFRWLMFREWYRARNAWLPRLAVPLLILPLLFALALHSTVPIVNQLPLLGFLAVLCTIWLGASLCLTAIVGERQVFDHERLLFLRPGVYLASKAAFYGLLAAMQTSLFIVCLTLLRTWTGRGETFEGIVFVWLVLVLVGQVSAAMGLAISAVAKFFRSQELANLLLPLVMLAQIVFSVQVAGDGNAPLHTAYGEFHVGHCQGREGCPEPVAFWVPDLGGSLCFECHATFDKAARRVEIDRSQDSASRADRIRAKAKQLFDEEPAHRQVKGTHVEPSRERNRAVQHPTIWATVMSYLTISRHADVALRGFAYDTSTYRTFAAGEPTIPENAAQREKLTKFGYATWITWGVFFLVADWIAFMGLARGLLTIN